MNALLCVGCDSYDHLSSLNEAEGDARKMFEALSSTGVYDTSLSFLLRSPSASQIVAALERSLPAGASIDVFTFFFAGHAAAKAGSFFLCTNETDARRLSTTALPIASLFQMLNEFRPRLSNIVIDACQAGGSSFDMSTLIKPDVLGNSESCSTVFLGACSANEYAAEDESGGILTRAVLKCVNGECEIQTNNEFLDLLEVASSVSALVRGDQNAQTPVSWGLSLFGRGIFSTNPHFTPSTSEKRFPLRTIIPGSPAGRHLSTCSTVLWQEYRDTQKSPCPRRMLNLLQGVVSGLPHLSDRIALAQGVAESFVGSAKKSRELFAPAWCVAACAVLLLPDIESEEVRSVVETLVRRVDEETRSVVNELASRSADYHFLLSCVGVPADLFYLPLRICKLLGWLGFSMLINGPNQLMREQARMWDLIASIFKHYQDSIVTVSEEQAPYIFVFVEACIRMGRVDVASELVQQYYTSFVEKRGKVAAVGVDGKSAANYVRSLAPSRTKVEWQRPSPSWLLPVLLHCGVRLSLSTDWDLSPLDGLTMGMFIPTSYADFGREMIEHGTNHTLTVGHGIWSPLDFDREYDRLIRTPQALSPNLGSGRYRMLCVLSSVMFPDRVFFPLAG